MKLINKIFMDILGCIQKDKRSYSEINKLIGLNKHSTAIYLKELVRMKLATRRISRGHPIRVYYLTTANGEYVFNAMSEIYRFTKDYEVV